MKTVSNSLFKQADAFINLKVTDSNGKVWYFQKGVPLYESRALDRSIISMDQEKLDDLFKNGQITGTVRMVDEESEGPEL